MKKERLRSTVTQSIFAVAIPRRISMNKLAITLATVAALSLSTAVIAQTSTTPSTPKAMQSAQPRAQATQQVKQSQTHATKHVKKAPSCSALWLPEGQEGCKTRACYKNGEDQSSILKSVFDSQMAPALWGHFFQHGFEGFFMKTTDEVVGSAKINI
jgi:hypothetical protein